MLRLFFLVLVLVAVGCASGGDRGPRDRDSGPGGDGGTGGGDTGVEVDSGPPCTADAECDDGLVCTGIETCASGRCLAGAPVDCDDAVACTVDACAEPDGTCSHVDDDAMCPAGLVCDGVDGCIAPTPCDVDADCDDGQMCNGAETCEPAFGCRDGTPAVCDDGIDCTVDTCDPAGAGGAGACGSTPSDAACSDGNACNGDEVCDPAGAGGCNIGTPMVCDDGIACTIDGCDPATGTCTASPDDVLCHDGVFCNGEEVCTVGTGCTSGTPPACADAIGCTVGRCDAATDACVQDPDVSVCQDGMACNGSEQCDITGSTPGTGCFSGIPLDCSDGVACTTDVCNEPGGTCTHLGSDADRDGFTAIGCSGGNDCDDRSAAIHPGATEVCDGVDNDCSGGADDSGGMQCVLGSGPRACTTSCTTAGSQSCNAACMLTPCRAASESCNDCDDDGDGTIDDGLFCRRGTSATCMTSCGTAGSRTCTADCSAYSACVAATETCNDCDDDGDGSADEGLPCRRGTSASCTTSCGTSGTRTCAADCSGYSVCRAATETCNDCDDDGDGSTDEGFACRRGTTSGCTTSCGTVGSQTCNAMCTGYGSCLAATETCNNCDDDGDGSTDEGFTCRQGATQSCTTSCGSTGSQTCNGSCTAFSTCSAAEICNGCDDDADGSADDGLACVLGSSRACTTACTTAGTQSCNGSCTGYGTCLAGAETCGNSCDDNGNGMIDEGCVPAGPPNDLCAGAISLPGASGTRSDVVNGWTAQTTDCAGGAELFYTFTLAQRSVVYFDTFGTAFDTKLSIRSSCGGAAVACEDDDCGVLQDQAVAVLAAGTHYVLAHAFSAGTTTGTMNLRWQIIPAAAGDNTRITTNGSYPGSVSGANVIGASCGGFAAGPEDGYHFTICPATTRTVGANTCTGTSYDSVLHMRSVAGELACNDDSCGLQSTTSAGMTGPGIFQVVVDTYSTGTGGTYSVAISGL